MARAQLSGMIVLRGSPAFTPGRIEKKLGAVRTGNPGVSDLYAEFVHFVDAEALDRAERETLEKLLTYGPRAARRALGGRKLVVVPRLGTTSPWSSKATDIAHICGLAAVARIERCIAYAATGTGLSARTLGAALSDRMTESVIIREADLGQVVAHGGTPRPLGVVALGA